MVTVFSVPMGGRGHDHIWLLILPWLRSWYGGRIETLDTNLNWHGFVLGGTEEGQKSLKLTLL